MCGSEESVPHRGGFCAYVRHFPAGAGFGRTVDAALIDLALRLKCGPPTAVPAPLTTSAQVLAAAARLDVETLAAFLRDHADEPVLATDN